MGSMRSWFARGQSSPRYVRRGAWLIACGVGLASMPSLTDRAGAAAAQGGSSEARQAAAGFHELFLHDACIGENQEQPDTCLHERQHQRAFTFGGVPGVLYDVTLRVRGLFEPTTIAGAETPDAAHPFFVIGGEGRTPDYSQWLIRVSDPGRAYTLNAYPSVSHTIYKEDFEATIPVAGGARIVVQVSDGNDRQIDNGAAGRKDRQQVIEGVVDTPRAGQMLRIDVVRVTARP